MRKYFITVICSIVAVLSIVLPSKASTVSSSFSSTSHAHAINYFPAKNSEAKNSARVGTLGTGNLVYHGGTVQTNPHLYLVFWGQWWNSSCAGEQGNGFADQSYLLSFFSGRGNSDPLSNVLTQYTGQGVRSQFNSKVLYGATVDCTNPPIAATQDQLATEAVKYSSYFKAHGQKIDQNTQIVVVSPSGTNPGGGFGTYCAWHSSVWDGSEDLSYTNLPYIPDQGVNCGAGFIRSPLDGWSIVGGHEFAEAVNDPNLDAWYDSADYEIGDKCSWSGIFVQTLSTGQFAEQPEWSNAGSGCALSDSTSITNPGTRSTIIRHTTSLQIHARASTVYCPSSFGTSCTTPFTIHRTVVDTVSGLPSGLHMSRTGFITGTPTHTGSYKVHITATETTTTAHSTITFTWKIT